MHIYNSYQLLKVCLKNIHIGVVNSIDEQSETESHAKASFPLHLVPSISYKMLAWLLAKLGQRFEADKI